MWYICIYDVKLLEAVVLKISLKKQMMIYFSAAFSIISVVFGFSILTYNTDSFLNQSYAYCKKIVESNILLVDTYLQQIKNVSRIIANDTNIIMAVTYRNNAETVDYPAQLEYQRYVTDKIKQADVLGNIENSLIIGDDYTCLYYYGNSPKRDYDFSSQQWFMEAIGRNGYGTHFTGCHNTDYLLTDSDGETVSIITPIMNPALYVETEKAYFMCDFKLQSILSSGISHGNMHIAIYEGQTPIYFSNTDGLVKEQLDQLYANLAAGEKSFLLEKAEGNPNSYIVVNGTLKTSGWTILGILPLTELEHIKNANTTFVIALMTVSIIIIVILSLLISRSILVPINMLVGRFHEIADGKTNVVFGRTKSEEVNLIARTADYMLDSIGRLNQAVVREHEQFSREQFKVLQQQINPHFLNNMLQSIKALAVTGDVAAISAMTTNLGKILSYAVYNSFDRVRLSEEIQYIKNYMALQKVRFANFEYTVDCPEGLMDISVPKLIIQPLVENSIEHGIMGGKSGKITVYVERDNDEIHIIVADNGIGISEEKRAEIERKLRCGDSGGESNSIGLLNVHQRIQSLYGKEYGVSILSRAGMDTCVVITIPIDKPIEKSMEKEGS